MPSIRSIAVSLPEFRYGNDEILSAAAEWLHESPQELALFHRFVASGVTHNRYFIQPLAGILKLNGMAARAELFEQEGVELGKAAAAKACQAAGVDPGEIDTFIFTSCTSPTIPAIDALLIEQLRMNPSVSRLPMYQHGCAGGVIGLSLANRFAQSGSKVLLTSVELCSLGFQKGNRTASNLVGSAIFGDGAAAVVVTPERNGLVFLDSQSVLTQNSRHLMGYDIHDDGTHLRLDKELPSFLSREVPRLVPQFLQRNGLKTEDIAWWLFHPGGAKILTVLEDTFQIGPERARWSREALRDYGNLSSASILFVTSNFLSQNICRDRDLVLIVGVGPGLTIELVLFEYREKEADA